MTSPDTLMWAYLSAGLGFTVLLALLLITVSELEEEDGRGLALLFPAVLGLAAFAYAGVGFGLEFGGVGLLDPRPGLAALVWEWSPLPVSWGAYWGMAGFAGWLLWGKADTPEAAALLVGHLPWALAAAWVAAAPLRRREGRVAPLVLAAVAAGVVMPLAGNWVHGGGWLGQLGKSLGFGAGFVDFGGSGVVGLVGGAMGLAVLLAFRVRRPDMSKGEPPPVLWPLGAAMGLTLLLVGHAGWALQSMLYPLEHLPLHRVVANGWLGIAGGAAVSTLYAWFFAGRWHPHITVMGGFAGWLVALAPAAYVQPWVALVLGLAAGALYPIVLYLVREVADLDDPAGIVSASLWGGVLGTLGVGLFADGTVGLPWAPDMPVRGLWAAGLSPVAVGQVYAQLVGLAALAIWGFLAGTLTSILLIGLQTAVDRAARKAPTASAGEAGSAE